MKKLVLLFLLLCAAGACSDGDRNVAILAILLALYVHRARSHGWAWGFMRRRRLI